MEEKNSNLIGWKVAEVFITNSIKSKYFKVRFDGRCCDNQQHDDTIFNYYVPPQEYTLLINDIKIPNIYDHKSYDSLFSFSVNLVTNPIDAMGCTLKLAKSDNVIDFIIDMYESKESYLEGKKSAVFYMNNISINKIGIENSFNKNSNDNISIICNCTCKHIKFEVC